MTPLEIARAAFWSEHPLCDLYRFANGTWQAGRYVPASHWSLRQLIDFAETLPATIITTLAQREESK